MNINHIINRIKNIIASPAEEWEIIKGEATSNKELIINYALPLIVLGGISQFIGSSVHFGIGHSAFATILGFIVPIIGIIIASYVINELAQSFNSRKDLNRAFKLVTYSYTPALVAAIVANLSVFLAFAALFGLYGIYLFWIGISSMMETPEEKKLTYVIVSALIIIVVNIVLGLIIGALMLPTLLIP